MNLNLCPLLLHHIHPPKDVMIPNLRNHTPCPIPKQESSPILVTNFRSIFPVPFHLGLSQMCPKAPSSCPGVHLSSGQAGAPCRIKGSGSRMDPSHTLTHTKTKFPKKSSGAPKPETQLQVGLTAAPYRAQISGFFNMQGWRLPGPGPAKTPPRTPPPSLPAPASYMWGWRPARLLPGPLVRG